MKFGVISSMLTTLVLVSTTAFAEPRSVDVTEFDIAGVKTGMSFEEARTAAASYLKVPINTLEPEFAPGEDPVTKTKLPKYFTYEKDGIRLAVYFEPRIPVDKNRPLAAYMIKYSIPWSKDNEKAMAEAALAKYGIQSNAPNDLPMNWCKNQSPNIGMNCPGHEPYLKLWQTNIELIDPTWQDARIKYMTDQQKRTPGF